MPDRPLLGQLNGAERVVVDAMRRGEQYYHEIDFEALKAENLRLRGVLRYEYEHTLDDATKWRLGQVLDA